MQHKEGTILNKHTTIHVAVMNTCTQIDERSTGLAHNQKNYARFKTMSDAARLL